MLLTLIGVPTAAAVGPYRLDVSDNARRTNPQPLQGAVVSGDAYVFAMPQTSDVTRVRFWLDNPAMSGAAMQQESGAPYDLRGGGSNGANAWNTTTVSDGQHTLTIRVDLTSGGPEVVHTTFTIQNQAIGSGALRLSSTSIALAVPAPGAQTSATAVLSAVAGNAISFNITDNVNWLQMSPASGVTPKTITFSANATGLANGTYTGTILATSAGSDPLSIPVVLTVGSSPVDQVHLSWVSNPATTMSVIWRTQALNVPHVVRYRAVGSGTSSWQTKTGTLRASGTVGMLHEVTITGLQSNSDYEYQVQGAGGSWSSTYQTRTAPVAGTAADFSAIYLADTGIYGRLDGLAQGTQQVVDTVAALDPLVVLGGGDYAYYDGDKRFGTLDNTLDAWFNQMQPVTTQAPFMPTYGNHEVGTGLDENFDSWRARFATPTGLANGKNYSFDIGDAHFVNIYAQFNQTGVGQSILDWISTDVRDAQARGQRWMIAYFHTSPFSDGSNHPSNITLRGQFGPLFEELGIQLALTSHDQSYERTYPLIDVPDSNTPTSTSLTCYDLSDGVSWVKTGPGGKWSNINGHFADWLTNPMPHWTAYRDNSLHHVLQVNVKASGEIDVQAIGMDGNGATSVVDQFRITANGDGCGSPPTPTLTLAPLTTSLSAIANGAAVSGGLQLTASSGTPTVSVSDDAAWLTVTPGSATAPQALTLSATPAGLAPGSYTATVTVSANGYASATASVTLTVTAAPVATYSMVYSLTNTRTNPVALDGATVSGNIYPFSTPDTAGIARVKFWLDNTAMSGNPYRSEPGKPYDFAGGSAATANAWDTSSVANGTHTITARVELSAGGFEAVTATFTVQNGPATDTTAPAVPGGVSATANANAIAVDWANNSEPDLAGYHVYRSTNAGGTFTKITSTLLTDSAFSDTTATAGQALSYRVTAVDTSGNESAASATVTATRPGASTYAIVYSLSNTRTNPVTLDGATVSGGIFAFTTPDTGGIVRVKFWLDNTAMTGNPFRSEPNGPYDFGGGSASKAVAWDTASVANGTHTITARIELPGGAVEVITVTFTVAN